MMRSRSCRNCSRTCSAVSTDATGAELRDREDLRELFEGDLLLVLDEGFVTLLSFFLLLDGRSLTGAAVGDTASNSRSAEAGCSTSAYGPYLLPEVPELCRQACTWPFDVAVKTLNSSEPIKT